MYHRLFYTFVKCYLDILCYCLTKRICKLSKNRIISKHLMLLFNTLSFFFIFLLVLFQNISCYCLTNDFTSFFNGLFKKTTILCTFPLFFPSAPSIYCFSKKVHISAISNTFSGNHLVKFCTFKYQ